MESYLLESRVQIQGHRFAYARARLYPTRLEVRGWGLRGRIRYDLALKDVTQVDWWTGKSPNLGIYVRGGERLLLSLRPAGTWRFTLGNLLSARTRVPAGYFAS